MHFAKFRLDQRASLWSELMKDQDKESSCWIEELCLQQKAQRHKGKADSLINWQKNKGIMIGNQIKNIWDIIIISAVKPKEAGTSYRNYNPIQKIQVDSIEPIFARKPANPSLEVLMVYPPIGLMLIPEVNK